MKPSVLHVTLYARRHADIEVGIQCADLFMNEFVKCLFCNGSACSNSFSWKLSSMLVVQTKCHRPKHNVEALKRHMIVGSHLRDILRAEADH